MKNERASKASGLEGVVVAETELSDVDRELIIRWMTRDYRAIFGGKTIAAPPK